MTSAPFLSLAFRAAGSVSGIWGQLPYGLDQLPLEVNGKFRRSQDSEGIKKSALYAGLVEVLGHFRMLSDNLNGGAGRLLHHGTLTGACGGIRACLPPACVVLVDRTTTGFSWQRYWPVLAAAISARPRCRGASPGADGSAGAF